MGKVFVGLCLLLVLVAVLGRPVIEGPKGTSTSTGTDTGTTTPTTSTTTAPPAPNISESFETILHLEYTIYNRTASWGDGGWAQDFEAGKMVQNWEIHDTNGSNFNFYHLDRYDLGESFFLDSTNRTCTIRPLNGTIRPAWAWLQNATYEGTFTTPFHLILDIWTTINTEGNFTL